MSERPTPDLLRAALAETRDDNAGNRFMRQSLYALIAHDPELVEIFHEETKMPKCDECGKTRTPADPDYNPMQLIFGGDSGWYSGNDGEICSPCMKKLYKGANQ